MEPNDILTIKNQIIANTVDSLQNYTGDNQNTRDMIDNLTPDMKELKLQGTTKTYKGMVKSGDTKLRLQDKIRTNVNKLKK